MKVFSKYKQNKLSNDHELLRTKTNGELDFTDSDPWRVLRIQGEFVEGFEALSKIGPAVSIFGSARTEPGSRFYEAAREIAKILAEPDMKDRIAKLGMQGSDMTPAQLGEFQKAEVAKWAQVIKSANIKLE